MDRFLINNIMTQIIDGRLSPGESLPSENSLSQQYGLPRITVRKNLNYLEEMGYIVSRQGKGRTVQAPRRQIKLDLTKNLSFSEKIRDNGLELENIQVFFEPIAYQEKIFRALGASSEDQVYRLGRLRLVQSEPIALHTSYLSSATFPDLENSIKGMDSLYDFFRSQGFKDFSSKESRLSVTFPTEEEQDLLYCPPLVPLLLLETETAIHLPKAKVLQLAKIFYRSDTFQYIL